MKTLLGVPFWYVTVFSSNSKKKFTLTGWVILATALLVSRLVASPLVARSQSGVATYFVLRACCQSNWVPHLCFKVSPCRSFCSQKPSQRHSLGRLAAPNKDHTKGRNVAPNSQTSCVLRTSGKLKGCFFSAIVCCFHVRCRTHKESSQSRRWAS